MIVVVSIGGSVLAPELSSARISSHADIIQQINDQDIQVGVVVGGGQIARDYISVARNLGENEIALDSIGIDATRLNAKLLIAALGDRASLAPPHTYEHAREILRRGEICVMGGVAPAQTTDAVSAALAEYVDADLLVYATSVPGVFDDDPEQNPEASRFEKISAGDLVNIIADIEMTAGSSAPVDLLAAKVIQRSGMRTIVLDGSKPHLIEKAVTTGEHQGTDIIPVDANADPQWWDNHRR